MITKMKALALTLILTFIAAVIGTSPVYADDIEFDAGYEAGYAAGYEDAQSGNGKVIWDHTDNMDKPLDYEFGFSEGYADGSTEGAKARETELGPEMYIKAWPADDWDYVDWRNYLDQWDMSWMDGFGEEDYEERQRGMEEAQAAYDAWYNALTPDEQWEIQMFMDDMIDEALEYEQALKDAEAAVLKRQAAAHAAKPITLRVNGKVVPTVSPPVIENGRTLAPISDVVNALGSYYTTWDAHTQTVGIYSYHTDVLLIEMVIGSPYARVIANGDSTYVYTDVVMDVPARIINGRTMVPVSFVAGRLYMDVVWDAENKIVDINAKG
jgi:hypothetical protein